MKAVPAPLASSPVHVGSDSEEEEVPQLVRRPRASRGDPALGAKNEHLKTPLRSSRPPQRAAPAIPASGTSSAGGPGERMLGIKDIRLTTQPTAWPVPERPAPTLPTAGKPARQAEDIASKTPSPSLLERQRPAPIATARTLVAEPAGDEFHTPLSSPSQLASPTLPTSPTSVSSSLSLSVPTSPSSIPSPSWPSSPEATTPVVPRREGKQPMPQSPPADTGPASPIEAVLHPAQAPGVGRLAEAFAVDIEALMRISLIRHGQATPREDLNFMHRLLERAKPFLDKKAELLQAQAALKDVLELGDLSGISRPRLRQLEALARADIRGQLADVSELKTDLADARQDIINGGGDPKWISQPPRPIREIEAERARRIAEDNEALRLGHYTL